jgi:26S proteasome regulatory subunit N1
MAPDADLPKNADKGKGKAVDDSKDEKPVLNGKKEDEKKDGKQLRDAQCHAPSNSKTDGEEELNEEDQQLKGELEMMVERLTVRNS